MKKLIVIICLLFYLHSNGQTKSVIFDTSGMRMFSGDSTGRIYIRSTPRYDTSFYILTLVDTAKSGLLKPFCIKGWMVYDRHSLYKMVGSLMLDKKPILKKWVVINSIQIR